MSRLDPRHIVISQSHWPLSRRLLCSKTSSLFLGLWQQLQLLRVPQSELSTPSETYCDIMLLAAITFYMLTTLTCEGSISIMQNPRQCQWVGYDGNGYDHGDVSKCGKTSDIILGSCGSAGTRNCEENGHDSSHDEYCCYVNRISIQSSGRTKKYGTHGESVSCLDLGMAVVAVCGGGRAKDCYRERSHGGDWYSHMVSKFFGDSVRPHSMWKFKRKIVEFSIREHWKKKKPNRIHAYCPNWGWPRPMNL